MDNDIKLETSCGEDKNFISKVLGEMKYQFNNKLDIITENNLLKVEDEESDVTEKSSDEVADEVQKIESEFKEIPIKKDVDSKSDKSSDEEQPRIVMCFRKPNNSIKSRELNRRSKRTKTHSVMNLKRSTRRRSKDYNESVLQSAIARKEKFYNETNKPQRLTRQLKPTQKILENIANAAALKDKKKEKRSLRNADKSTKDDDSEDINKTGKAKMTKKIKLNHSRETPESTNGSDTNKHRRSDRFTSHNNNNDSSDEVIENNNCENSTYSPNQIDSNSASAQLIASRLCVCTQSTQLYVISEKNDDVYCTAIDSIGNKLIGCNNIVDHKEMTMLRPSTRVPYLILCKIHRNRMLRHNCCATCGIFCTQGQFSQCENKHQYHRLCQITVGELECCPHCGEKTPKYNVSLNMETFKPPVFLSSQSAEIAFGEIDIKVEKCKRDCESPPLLHLDDLKLTNLNSASDEFTEYTIKDLLSSIKEGNYSQVATILGSGSIDLNTSISYEICNGTVLHYCATNGLIPAIHLLKMAGIDLDILDEDQNSALMLAVINFQNDTVKYLTKAGASVVTKGVDGMTALHLSAKCGNLEASQIILTAAAHIKGYKNFADDGGWTPLVWACEHGHVDSVKYFLSEGADPLLSDVEQNVALHWAAFSGSSKIVEMILNFGGNVTVVNAHGDTPLHIAARQDNYNCVLILLARSSNIHVVNEDGESPIDCCPTNSKSFEALSLNIRLQNLVTVKV